MTQATASFTPIPRFAQSFAQQCLESFPVLTITGPRQSGKTTLARLLRPQFPYFSLEDPDVRAFALDDPRGFLRQCENGAILDEIQRAPSLFSYLQSTVDADRRLGRFILTGSSQLALVESVTQSLAGRSALLTLLPFSLAELQAAGRAPKELNALLYAGLFPPLYDRSVSPSVWLQNYVSTYLEKDVRQLLNIHQLDAFQRFIQLCAGRVGQLLNVSNLAADAGITRVTAQAWLTVLQASHLIFLLPPWLSNRNKRLIKSAKLYFCDVGLAAWLVGARALEHLPTHPQRGALFENWVITELLKAHTHQGRTPRLCFLRDKQGHEVDALIEIAPLNWQALEIKSGETIASDWFDSLNYWAGQFATDDNTRFARSLIYGGTNAQTRQQTQVFPWCDLALCLKPLTSLA